MSENKQRHKDFAIIHNTPKGQLLITKEPGNGETIITYWMEMETVMIRAEVKIEDKNLANEAFDNARDYEKAKTFINEVLNREYL